MTRVLDRILDGLYAFYLGASLSIFGGIYYTDLNFYLIVVPTIVLINVFKKDSV